MNHYLYLFLNISSILIPFAFSFENKIGFYKNRKPLFMGIGIMSLIFIAWDIVFTKMGIWGFNPEYLTGINIINLPLEEWLFFFCIPYACMFIYEAMRYYVKKDLFGKWAIKFSIGLSIVLLIVALLNLHKWYTSVTFTLTGAFLLWVAIKMKPDYMGRFYLGYLVSLIPFFFVNGLLTGTWIPEEVVWYNDAENLQIRIATIPIEDSIYMLLMLLIVTVVYEQNRRNGSMVSK